MGDVTSGCREGGSSGLAVHGVEEGECVCDVEKGTFNIGALRVYSGGGAVTEVRPPRVPHDWPCQALEGGDACRHRKGGREGESFREGEGKESNSEIISTWCWQL